MMSLILGPSHHPPNPCDCLSTPAVGILCGDASGGALPITQTEALAEALLQSCLGLVHLLHSLTAGAGPSLREALQKAAAAALDPAKTLIKDMFKPDAHKAVMASVGTCPWMGVHGNFMSHHVHASHQLSTPAPFPFGCRSCLGSP